jgi:hypothetical protein
MSTKLEALTQRLNADPALSDALSEYFREHAAERDALRAEVERLSSALAEQESRANKFHEQAEANALETTELRRAICEAMGYSTKVVYPSDAEIATRVQALHERCAHQDAAFIKGAPHDEALVIDRDEMLANARLIAAAPELLEALERVAEACERSAAETCCCPSCWEHPYGDGSGHSSDCAVSAARAAIKKARGEGYFQREHLAGDGGRSAVNKRTT